MKWICPHSQGRYRDSPCIDQLGAKQTLASDHYCTTSLMMSSNSVATAPVYIYFQVHIDFQVHIEELSPSTVVVIQYDYEITLF